MAAPEVIAIGGGGQAGGWAAKTLRQHGFAGRVVVLSEETHPPYERPPLSKQVLLQEAPPESTYLFPAQTYAESSIELRLGVRVASVDAAAHELLLASGERLRYDRLLLATGAEPRRLAAARGSNVFYLRSIADAAALAPRLRSQSHVLIVGGGWIGLEVAAAARKRGAAVTVVESASRVCSRAAPEDVSARLLELHRARGVDVRVSTQVARFEGVEEVQRAVLSSGDVIDVSTVVVAIGIVPATQLAERAGLHVENGIAIDAQMRTSAPDLFAAGDVACYMTPEGTRKRLESWDNAQKQGIAAAKAMLGIETRLDAFPWFWSDQFGVNLQLIGGFAAYDECVPLPERDPGSHVTLYFRGSAIVGAVGVNAGRDMRVIKRSLENGQALPAALTAPVPSLPRAVGA